MIEHPHDSIQDDQLDTLDSHTELRKLITKIQTNPDLTSKAKAKQMQVSLLIGFNG